MTTQRQDAGGEEPERDAVQPRAGGAGQRDREEQDRERHRDLGQARDDACRASRRSSRRSRPSGRRAPSRTSSRRRRPRARSGRRRAGAGTRRGRAGCRRRARRSVFGKWPVAPGYGSVATQDSGPFGSRFLSRPPPVNRSFGPWPRKCAAIGAPPKHDEEQEDDEEAAADRDLVAPEPPPDLLPVATGANGLGALAERRRLDLDDAVEPGRAAACRGLQRSRCP